MPLLMMKCPHTARPVRTGIELEVFQVEILPDVPLQVSCSACGMVHTTWKRECWVADKAGRALTEPAEWVGLVRPPQRARA
jgi:hypothetical protein